LERNLEECCASDRLEDARAELYDMDFITKQTVRKWAERLSMSDEEFAEQRKLTKEFRDLLVFLIKKQTA
jgi:hypothetical protein